jgi:NAD(P)-dependent dehydrogenase (short-subunit alcohol dehydrogenase family)
MSRRNNSCVIVTSIILAIVAITVGIARLVISPPLQELTPTQYHSLHSEVVLITGGCSGIGEQVSILLDRLHTGIVILGCRNVTKASQLCSRRVNSPMTCYALYLDLSSFAAVRNFTSYLQQHQLIPSIVINNAGIRHNEYVLTEDGIESHYAVNYLSSYLLTRLLLPNMLQQHSRLHIVHISSTAHEWGRIDTTLYAANHTHSMSLDSFTHQQRSSMEGIYGDTKLMQLLFSYQLQRHFNKIHSPKAVSVSVHPGFVDSRMGHADSRFLQAVLVWLRPVLARSSEQAALTVVHACVSATLQGGEYLDNQKVVRPSAAAMSAEMAQWLWDNSAAITGMVCP